MNDRISPQNESCKINGINLHSKYNPYKEAENFVLSINYNTVPKYIVVTGPALSYCLPFLREKFPNTFLIAIYYSETFFLQNVLWDKKFLYSDKALSERLYSLIGEENWSQTVFVSWKPSERAFPSEYENTWNEIKKATIKSRNVLTTRTYFNKRWALNVVNFCRKIKRVSSISVGDEPIIITASGNSLVSALPFLKKNRKKYFLIALSSAIKVLQNAKIVPNLIISTDGGYWASYHLLNITRCIEYQSIPVAAALESSVPTIIFENNPIIPLSYGDGLDYNLSKMCDIQTTKAARNGTVSGTAAELALSLTTNKIYFCGLDLAENFCGFSHAQPNSIEDFSSQFDTKLSSKESRLTLKENTASLEIYASWFASRPPQFTSRVFRIRGEQDYITNLHPIKDIDYLEAEKFLSTKSIKKIKITKECEHNTKQNFKIIQEYILTSMKHIENELVKTNAEYSEQTVFWLKTAHLAKFLKVYKNKNESIIGLKKELNFLFKKMLRSLQNDIK